MSLNLTSCRWSSIVAGFDVWDVSFGEHRRGKVVWICQEQPNWEWSLPYMQNSNIKFLHDLSWPLPIKGFRILMLGDGVPAMDTDLGTDGGPLVDQLLAYFQTASWFLKTFNGRIIALIQGQCVPSQNVPYVRLFLPRTLENTWPILLVKMKERWHMLGSYCYVLDCLHSRFPKICFNWFSNSQLKLLCENTREPQFQVIHEYVNKDALIPSAKKHLTLVPSDTMDEFYLPLEMFDISKDSKNGCGGLKKRYNWNGLFQCFQWCWIGT